jgi:nucleotide-binding universal stress UspA family protein
MMEFALALAHRGAGISLMSAYGSRAHHILAAANDRNADLIIIGESTSDGGGKTLRRVVHEARCPVLILDSYGSHLMPTWNPRAQPDPTYGARISI